MHRLLENISLRFKVVQKASFHVSISFPRKVPASVFRNPSATALCWHGSWLFTLWFASAFCFNTPLRYRSVHFWDSFFNRCWLAWLVFLGVWSLVNAWQLIIHRPGFFFVFIYIVFAGSGWLVFFLLSFSFFRHHSSVNGLRVKSGRDERRGCRIGLIPTTQSFPDRFCAASAVTLIDNHCPQATEYH